MKPHSKGNLIMKLGNLKAEAEALKASLAAENKNPEEERLANIQAAIDAEEKRLNSKAYKNALKAIDELAEEAENQKQAVVKAVDDLMVNIEAWKTTALKRRRLASEHRIETADLYQSEIGKIGHLVELETRVTKWLENKRFCENTNMLPKSKPANPKKIIPIGKHEKMMRERYPRK